jgi:sulfhydrogenase subunit beta (sulfur reductase)
MRYVVLQKERFNNFISKLAQEGKVAAPVAKGYNNYAFQLVTRGEEVAIKYLPTILPPKKYFMPQYENLLKFNLSQGQDMEAVVEYEKITIFGVHTCDLAGIQCLNTVFEERPKDINYLIRKNKINIIGLECNDYCDEYASCALMGNELPQGGYDLFFTDLDDYFMVHIFTQSGEEIVEKTKVFEPAEYFHKKALENLRANKRRLFKPEVPIELQAIPALFDKSYESPVWDDLDKRCLACGNCTNVCPTCYCFDVFDDLDLDLKTGIRWRRWDSCQNESFAKVAGGENFRKTRGARQRHRYYRKFKYSVDRFSSFFCTGCGRCSRTCMAGIRLKETLNALIAETTAQGSKT